MSGNISPDIINQLKHASPKKVEKCTAKFKYSAFISPFLKKGIKEKKRKEKWKLFPGKCDPFPGRSQSPCITENSRIDKQQQQKILKGEGDQLTIYLLSI